MKYFTKGGIFAALPIPRYSWSPLCTAPLPKPVVVLGIQATKKVQPRVAPKRPAAEKASAPAVKSERLIRAWISQAFPGGGGVISTG